VIRRVAAAVRAERLWGEEEEGPEGGENQRIGGEPEGDGKVGESAQFIYGITSRTPW
jgi:hypothetical protein